MKIIKPTRKILEEIQNYFDKIETLYLEIPEDIQDHISKIHNENFSFPYCIRWWRIAIDEIVENWL